MANGLIAQAPASPDFHLCHPYYNEVNDGRLEPILMSDCLRAEAQIERSNEPMSYYWWQLESDDDNPDPDQRIFLPRAYRHGGCEIVIDIVDPVVHNENPAQGPISIVPRVWREMAGWVIDQCIGGSTSTGGFVTRNISNAINFLSTTEFPPTEWDPYDRAQFPISATFFTVLVSTPNEWSDLDEPGERDPAVGGKIFTSLHEILLRTSQSSSSWNRLNAMAERIGVYWGRMSRDKGNQSFWWGPKDGSIGHSKISNSDKTTYECDSTLGSPKPVDCSQLQYSAFPISGDASIHVRPGESKILHSESCSIGISSRIPMTLTWEIIKAAVNSLVETCVNNPRIAAVGGRAYHRDRKSSDIDGKGELKRRGRNVTVSDVLPPGANITLFQTGGTIPS